MTYSRNSFTRFSVALGSGLPIMILVSACNLTNSPSSNAVSTASTVTTPNPNPTSTPVAQVALGSVSQQQMNLGVSMTVPVTIQSQNGYAGPVTLSLNNKVLAANDPMNTVTVSIAPATVNLTAGGTAQASVSIVSSSSTPDLNTTLQVLATTPKGQVSTMIPLMVNAVFEIDILSSGNVSTTGIEDWTIAALTTTNFTTHPNGVKVMFCNKDTVEKSGFYRIHSTATAFLHQGTEGLGLPGTSTPDVNDAAVAGSKLIASTMGPCYTVDVLSQVAKLSDSYWDHNNESSTKGLRTLVFNAYATPPIIGKSGNPNASFAYLQKNLINTSMCISCHVTTPSTGGGFNFSTYAGVMKEVQAGSALGSSFYVQIAPGGPMPQNDPGSVPAALVQDVQDWINDGALNN
jgi:hypothetical protein